MACQLLFVFLLACPAFLHGVPIDADPSALADPAAAAVPVATAPIEAAPVAAAIDPAAGTKGIPGSPGGLGGGIITEQKNPDGSTITITRYNGPLPASAFAPMHQNFAGIQSLYDSSLYQTQLLQQALLRNAYSYPLSYSPYSSYNSYNYASDHFPYYRSQPYYMSSYSAAPFYSPFFGFGGGYPFYPGYGAPVAKTV